MNLEISNPSPFSALKIYTQDRARNVVAPAAPAAPTPKRETRAELEVRGATITMKPCRGTVREADGALRSIVREVPTPLWQLEGADSLAHWVTDILEQGVRDSQKAAPACVRSERVVDEWRAPVGRQSVPPGGKVLLNLEEHIRLVVECADDEVMLQIANVSPIRTIRLQTRDKTTGATSHSAWIPPARDYPNAANVTAGSKHGAVISLQPS